MQQLQRDPAQQAQAIQSLLGPGFAVAQETIRRFQAQLDGVIEPLRKTIDEMAASILASMTGTITRVLTQTEHS